jgi:hypothetical protein
VDRRKVPTIHGRLAGAARGSYIGNCQQCGREATLRLKDDLCVFCRKSALPDRHWCQYFMPHRNGACARLAYVQVPAIAPGGQEWRCAKHGGKLKREVQARERATLDTQP